MKLPTQLFIGDDIYGVEYRKRFNDSRTTVGLCCYDTQRILLKRGQSPHDHLDTFIHELLHAITDVYKEDMKRVGVKLSHETIYFLAKALSHVLEDNWGIELEDAT